MSVQGPMASPEWVSVIGAVYCDPKALNKEVFFPKNGVNASSWGPVEHIPRHLGYSGVACKFL